MEERTAERLTGVCRLVGGTALPCTREVPCPRVRLGVDEWEPEVETVLALYFRMMGWSAPGLGMHAGLVALARRDLRAMLADVPEEDVADLLYLAQRLHLEVARSSEDSNGPTA